MLARATWWGEGGEGLGTDLARVWPDRLEFRASTCDARESGDAK